MKGKASRKKDREPVESITAEESLKRMAAFGERREKFIATIQKSKDRNIPANKK